MCDVTYWENTYLDHMLLRDVDLQLVTEYARKLATAFFKGCTSWNKGTSGDTSMTDCLCILAGIYGVLVRNESKMEHGKVWTDALAKLFTGLQPVSMLPFGILGVYGVRNGET